MAVFKRGSERLLNGLGACSQWMRPGFNPWHYVVLRTPTGATHQHRTKGSPDIAGCTSLPPKLIKQTNIREEGRLK